MGAQEWSPTVHTHGLVVINFTICRRTQTDVITLTGYWCLRGRNDIKCRHVVINTTIGATNIDQIRVVTILWKVNILTVQSWIDRNTIVSKLIILSVNKPIIFRTFSTCCDGAECLTIGYFSIYTRTDAL